MVEEALIPREPITIVLSRMGWVRALKGHTDDVTGIKHKDGDETAFSLKAETTDKILMLTTDGRVYTLDASKLPGGRGFGEPVRLLIDMDESAELQLDNMAVGWAHETGACADGRERCWYGPWKRYDRTV